MHKKFVLPAALAVVGALLLIVAAFAGTGSATAAAGKTVAKKGGTLKVNISNGDFEHSDPGLAYDTLSWSMLYTTQMLLVNFPEKPGAAGAQLYPEAATAFPTVSKDGKTYTFKIRPGLKFSDGSALTAAAFQRALERNLSPKMGSPVGVNIQLQKLIAGGEAFLDGKAQKIAGVSAKGLTLTVKLTKPNPAFVAIMGMQWFGAVRPDTPYSSDGLNNLPSAGPYVIKSRDVGRSLVEVRNPNYKGTRPANPDQIVWTANTDSDQSLLQVKAGQADIDASQPPAVQYADLGQKYGVNKKQFFVGPTSCILYYALNTSRAPFSSLAMRKAANWALDRPALVRLSGKYSGHRSDQILVPGVPGYKPYNIYAIKGADVAKAKQIAGGPISGTVTVLHSTSASQTARAQVIEYNLKQIGFDTKDRPIPGGLYYKTIGTRGADFDLVWAGWCADYFDPFDYINVNLDGRSIQDANNVNFAYLNSAKLNAAMDHAASLTGAARVAAYQKLDLTIMRDYAPWVSYINLSSVFFVSPRVSNYVYSNYFTEPYYNALAVG
jgi:peptide/nickel transport system substrate-binding protein